MRRTTPIGRQKYKVKAIGQSNVSYSKELIAQIQKRLYNLGIERETLVKSSLKSDGTWDGILGEGTKTAIRKFQEMNNLPATGIPDNKTLELLGFPSSNETNNETVILPYLPIARERAEQEFGKYAGELEEGETLYEFLTKLYKKHKIGFYDIDRFIRVAQNIGIKPDEELSKEKLLALLARYKELRVLNCLLFATIGIGALALIITFLPERKG